MRRPTCLVLLVAAGLAGCGGLDVRQEHGWEAFHECQQGASSAVLEQLFQNGGLSYRTVEGVEFGSMKACMERRGYACDLGLGLGRVQTYCSPKAS